MSEERRIRRTCGMCGHYYKEWCGYFWMPTRSDDKIAITCKKEFQEKVFDAGMGITIFSLKARKL